MKSIFILRIDPLDLFSLLLYINRWPVSPSLALKFSSLNVVCHNLLMFVLDSLGMKLLSGANSNSLRIHRSVHGHFLTRDAPSP